MNRNAVTQLAIGFIWLLLLAAAAAVYWPGLHGPFLFDDYPNLKPLGQNGGVSDWDTFLAFVLGGFSGPTGRPLSLLTFLLNAVTWPAESFSFKYTNLCIHLLNATLVFAVTLKILAVSNLKYSDERAGWLALVCAALWLLHPALVSTTLYVVQRMAMLSTLFCLVGMLAYLHGRILLDVNRKAGYLWMSVAVAVGTVLATLSKENGILLPALIWCLESAIGLMGRLGAVPNRFWKLFFLAGPTAVVALYLFVEPVKVGWFSDYSNREYSPYERVLTQFRVVLSYLGGWFVPGSGGGRVYYDDVEVSRSLWNPVSTAAAMAATALLIGVAVRMRRTFPLFFFAITFYFVSLLVESTTVGLELKFDHRFYLGSTFLFLPLAVAALEHLSASLRFALSALLMVIMAVLTLSAATLWGDYQKLTLVWAKNSPHSSRAQTEAAQMLFVTGRVEESVALMEQATVLLPDDFRLQLTKILVKCRVGRLEKGEMDKVLQLANTGPYRHTDFNLLNSFFESTVNPGCPDVSLEYYLAVVKNLLASSSYTSPHAQAYSQLHYYYGLGLLRAGQTALALEMLDKTLKSRHSLHIRMNIAANKASAGLLKEALEDATYVYEQLESGTLSKRALVEAPRLSDVQHFIRVVTDDLPKSKPTPEPEIRKEGSP